MDKILKIELHPADVLLICTALLAYDNQTEFVSGMVGTNSDQIGMDFETLESLEAFYKNRQSSCHRLCAALDKLLR